MDEKVENGNAEFFLWSLRPKFEEGGLKAEFIYGH